VDLPKVDGCVGRVWDEHTCGVHHCLSADDHGMQARQAEEGSSTTPLVMGATDGPGRQRCNWFRRVTVRSKSHPAVRQRGTQENNWATRKPSCSVTPFLVESTSVGYVATAYCVCLSLVLILVVKILGGGGTSSELW
jgi:hypothetical protein